ncbi:SDR family NAD(P)-dependent oxidoreductase [Mangrovibacter plantisponsor]|uniref:NAD(P)-dependent dehydrogenase (Short-subunit alcohol dehydrogenase family) n=1 Tax=Mangrovibacter plantisponsor TaxID=451513 RepID=A0A317PXY7_9ENTR|nr:3-oxoacyl-ACP reductase family protein [Mangrovibacter plantisponsor]PWW07582.1 NAD(P)-dependent dehydrogenase (short-subunit alcohol dehydrogenase family) [Mangrovibacter plantisponsor]
MYQLEGKRALVTGASRGIGAAIAVMLAEHGANVAITYQNSDSAAQNVVSSIEAFGRKAFAIKADSADALAVSDSVEQAVAQLGGLDILVNNAGIGRPSLLADMSLDQINALLDVNVRSVIVASKAAISHLRDGGRIISIGSSAAERVSVPGMSVYAATKSALLALTRGLARELGPQGITVNLVHPGSTDTELNPDTGDFADHQRALTALGRFGKPEDIAAAVVFLAGPSARQITGTGIVVDGGANA